MNIQFVVQRISTKTEGKYGLFDGNVWYSGFGSCPAAKGDKVSIEYEENGTFKNVRVCDIISKAQSPEASLKSSTPLISSRDVNVQKYIIRQNVLGHAVNIWKDASENHIGEVVPFDAKKKTAIDHVIEIAEQLERWVYRE